MKNVVNVIIFGTAQRGSEIFAILSQLPQYNPIAFSCNDETVWGTEKNGLQVIAPKDMRRLYPDSVVIIASASYVEIDRQLIREQLLPAYGCLQIQQVLSGLSREEREVLQASVKRDSCFYDLAYQENDIPPDDNSSEKYLVICNGGYPTDKSPRCMFAHKRVLHYIKAGLKVEAFGLVAEAPFEEYTYQGVKVFQGGALELQRFLKDRHYKKFLIHFIEPNVMDAIERAGKADTPTIIWCHGYEVMPWYERWFNYTPEDIQKKGAALERQNQERRDFLQRIYARAALRFIFVSNWEMRRSEKFVGRLPEYCCVIPNLIDHDFFASPEKTVEDRLHILSIKSHSGREYANDLTAKAILELSTRECFEKLTFDLYGDGTLFEDNFGELLKRDFPNVHIHRRFLTQSEMREKFRENGVFLSPTRVDSHQVTISEAMSAGMAPITTNAGPMREFLDEDCGSIFEMDNYWMMAEEIEYLYDQPDAFLQKAKNARARVTEQCGYDKTVKKEIKLILGHS